MIKVYIDVTNLLTVNFITGIQRVVREVAVRMILEERVEVVLLASPAGESSFTDRYQVIDNNEFVLCFRDMKADRTSLLTTEYVSIRELSPGSVFFDIDSVWMSPKRRSYLYPELKSRGVKICVYIYDVIPIEKPQYAHENTMFFFMSYFGAVVENADIVIASAQVTLDKIQKLAQELGRYDLKGYVSWLGSDFFNEELEENAVSRTAMEIAKLGKYVLCVGTIEPRKNHNLLLDAYDRKLKDLGINLIFAGRFGWNIQDIKKRIESHENFGAGIYHLVGMNDATIDFLYRNAFIVAFPTFDEGFGLPMIEAFERDCVLIASDIPVLREVGKDFCDYCPPDDEEQFVSLVEHYLNSPEAYAKKKEYVKRYEPVAWDDVTCKIMDALCTLDSTGGCDVKPAKQMVMLSARPEALLETIPYIEKFMRFIQEIVICCPDKAVSEIQDGYHGKLKITFLTDSEAIGNTALPEDHITRNFYLRCCAIKSKKIDDVFIMSDDDYRPLTEVTLENYIDHDRYIAYYFYDLRDWTGTAWAQSSFDIGEVKTSIFLQDERYSTFHFAVHMPQIIDKRIFLEMLEKHPQIATMGYCEWNTYFNYGIALYPNRFQIEPYRVMCWPGDPQDWRLQVKPDEFLFENYYEENYQEGGIFSDLSPELCDDIENQNKIKIKRFRMRQNQFMKWQTTVDTFSSMFEHQYREKMQINIVLTEQWEKIALPKYILANEESFFRIPMRLQVDKDDRGRNENIIIDSYLSDGCGNFLCHTTEEIKLEAVSNLFDYPLWCRLPAGTWTYNIVVKYGKTELTKSTPLVLIT